MARHGTAHHGTAQHNLLQHASLVSRHDEMHALPLPRLGSLVHYLASHSIDIKRHSVFCSYFFFLPLPHASKPSQMPAMRHLTLSSNAGSPGFTAGLSSFTSSVPELWSILSVVPLSALHVTRMCGDLWHDVSQTSQQMSESEALSGVLASESVLCRAA